MLQPPKLPPTLLAVALALGLPLAASAPTPAPAPATKTEAAPAPASAAAPAPTPAAGHPNIVFIFSDDHAAHALSAYRGFLRYGARLPDTPNLDRIARDGMLFVNAFVTNSICEPSRATVLTGQYGHLNGVMENQQPLHPTTITFPKLLRAAGYRTGLFGKWHLETTPEGFDKFEVLRGQGPYYNPDLISGGPDGAPDTTRATGYTTDLVTDSALAWVDGVRRGRAPFLLMLQYNAPHRYWDPGPRELELYRDTVLAEPTTLWDDHSGHARPASESENTIALDLFQRDLKLTTPDILTPQQRIPWEAAYDSSNAAFRDAQLRGDELTRWRYQRFIKDYMRVVEGMDRAVGRVLDYLAANGLDRNTLVVYSSDQGFFLGDHGWFDKRWMYEESLRTPLLVRWPGVVAAGSVNRDMVMNLDFAETLLDAAGVNVPDAMQGRSILPLLRGKTPSDWRDAVYYQYFEYPGWHMVRRQYGVRTRRYTLVHFYETGAWELFDLDRDPDEMNSVYDDPAYAPVVRRLKQKLIELRQQYRVPDQDPAPHRVFEPGPTLRRPLEMLPDTMR